MSKRPPKEPLRLLSKQLGRVDGFDIEWLKRVSFCGVDCNQEL